MNKDQRKYLSEWIDNGFRKEREAIINRRKRQPELNNYLVAEALAGTLKLQPAETVMQFVVEQIKSAGPAEVLVQYHDPEYSNRWDNSRRLKKPGGYKLTVPVEALFIYPQEYLDAIKIWKEQEELIEAELAELEALRDALLLKINIGSGQVLADIIAQADKLPTLDLINKQISSSAGQTTTKALKAAEEVNTEK